MPEINIYNRFKDFFFSKIHNNKLVYNTCWEDPRCDRMLLELDQDSEILMITSAGCNALEYLLDDPKRIDCVDVNFRQNALLEFKKSIIAATNHTTFFEFFGLGSYADAQFTYWQQIRETLPEQYHKFWDKYINYFDGKGLRKSFYYHGSSGLLAFLVTHLMKMKAEMKQQLNSLFSAINLSEQINHFRILEQILYNHPIVKFICNNHYSLTLAGVPASQQQIMNNDFKGGPLEYIQSCLEKIFTTLPISENYFYQVYIHGHYTKECCPAYLKSENFQTLKERENKIFTHTCTISQFLASQSRKYSHFILLDHQDWLAANDRLALEHEWRMILDKSKPGSKILMRSAAKKIDYIPSFALDKVDFDNSRAEAVHQLDRVGTYGSVYLGTVK